MTNPSTVESERLERLRPVESERLQRLRRICVAFPEATEKASPG